MAFFIGIAGPWIVLMALDLFWTRQGLEGRRIEGAQGLQARLEHLLRRREGRAVPIPARRRVRGAPDAAPGRPVAGNRELGAMS